MSAEALPLDPTLPPRWGAAAQAMFRAAQAVSHAGGPGLFGDLVHELADILRAATVFIAVFKDDDRTTLRTLAAVLDGKALASFDYALAGSPCAQVVGKRYRYVERGVAAEFRPGTLFAAKGMDSYAAFPLNDSGGVPVGLLVAMDRAPVADAQLAEALLKIFAGRIVAEIERSRADDALRAAALAVSSARGESVFVELVRYLATILRVELAFIAIRTPDDEQAMELQAVFEDGQVQQGRRYRVAGTPCATVVGGALRAYPSRLRELFPDDDDVQRQGWESYAGFPMRGLDGRTLGHIAVSSRQPLVHLERVESMLQIFAIRAAAEIEQLRGRDALRRSAASYRAIFDAAEDAVFIHDWDSGAILDVNPKACETYGWSRDELCRLSVADLSSGVPPYTAAQAAHFIGLAKLGRCPPFEWHRRNRDGSLRWDEVRLKPAQIDGRPHVLAFTRDITERKAALEALRSSEQQYRAIFDSSADAMGLWNETLRLVDVNRAFTRISGWTREDVLGQQLGERDGEPEAARRAALIRAALAGDEGRIEVDVPRKDGSRMFAEVRYVPVAFGGVSYALSIARDIGERRERERALQDSEARLRTSEEQYRAIFNASTEALILWNSRYQRVDVNDAFHRLFGWTRDEVIGRGFEAQGYMPGNVWPRRELVRRALAGEACSAELEAVCKSGERIMTEVQAIPFRHRGEPHVLAIARDITDRHRAEQQRRELERQLRQAQKMEAIGQLTGGIAHDFNNILTSVIGYLVLGQERAEALADSTLVRQLGQAHLAAERARELIAQMLAFARRQRGERRRLELRALVRQSLQLLRPTLPSTLMLDTLTLDAPAAPPAYVCADAVQVEQVLLNLCINARDAMAGCGTLVVRVGGLPGRGPDALAHCASCGDAVGAGPWVELAVGDSGDGIAPEVLRRMFEPFYTTKEVGRGSGMGLAMVHGIVHEHGGHVVVDTAPGLGSLFRVLLPAAGGDADEPPPPPARVRDPQPALRGRVLVVDDERMVGDFMAELLDGWGLQVVLRRDGASALAWLLVETNEVDLIVTDQTMPRMTGIELAQRCRALRPTLPVLLYTGNPEALDPAVLARAGVRELLRKPVEPAALRRALQQALAAA